MPGSVQAVRNRTDNTKTNKNAPMIGMAMDIFSDKYGQLKNNEFNTFKDHSLN